MIERCEPHGNLLLDPAKPFPAGESDYCHACWRAAGGIRRGPPAAKTTVPATCPRLALPLIRLPGSPRVWQRCGGGYGSTTQDERAGLVCGCQTPAPGVWRKGKECGPKCPGYPKAG